MIPATTSTNTLNSIVTEESFDSSSSSSWSISSSQVLSYESTDSYTDNHRMNQRNTRNNVEKTSKAKRNLENNLSLVRMSIGNHTNNNNRGTESSVSTSNLSYDDDDPILDLMRLQNSHIQHEQDDQVSQQLPHEHEKEGDAEVEYEHAPNSMQRFIFHTRRIRSEVDPMCQPQTMLLCDTDDLELDELNKTIESDLECIGRDADTLIQSLQVALQYSQGHNQFLQDTVQTLSCELHQLRVDLTHDQHVQSMAQPISSSSSSSSFLSERNSNRTQNIFPIKIVSGMDDESMDHEETFPNVCPPHQYPTQEEQDDQVTITQVQRELQQKNLYILTLDEKIQGQSQELSDLHDKIHLLESQLQEC